MPCRLDACEQQARDVRPGNGKQQAGGAEQDAQDRCGIAYDVGLQALEAGPEAEPLKEVFPVDVGIGIREFRRQAVDLRLGARQRRIGAEFRDDEQTVLVVVRAARIDDFRQPYIRVVRELLAKRFDDADDRNGKRGAADRAGVEMDLLADDVRIGTELRLPESAGDNRGKRCPGIVIRLDEGTPDDRAGAEHPVDARRRNGDSRPDG